MTNIEVQQFKEKKEQGEEIRNLVGVFTMSDDVARSRAHAAPGSTALACLD